METAEILNKAADVIAERGWHRGAYENPHDGGVCAMGAMCVAAGLPPRAIAISCEAEALDDVFEAERHLRRFLGAGVTEWNDEIAENPDEVAAALREAAKAVEKRGAS